MKEFSSSREKPTTGGVLDPLPPHDHFTVVFEGNLRDIKHNPFMTKTPFGLPRHVGVGNAFDEFDEFCAIRDQLRDALQLCRERIAAWEGWEIEPSGDPLREVIDAALSAADTADRQPQIPGGTHEN